MLGTRCQVLALAPFGGGRRGDGAVGSQQGEDLVRDVEPGLRRSLVGDVVAAEGCPGRQQVDDCGGKVTGEGETTVLIGDDLRTDAATGQTGHGVDEVVAFADDPAGA